jgi:hypothetical protein
MAVVNGSLAYHCRQPEAAVTVAYLAENELAGVQSPRTYLRSKKRCHESFR